MAIETKNLQSYNADNGILGVFDDALHWFNVEWRPLSKYQTNPTVESIVQSELDAALLDIGTRPTQLLIDKDLRLSSKIVIPKNVRLTPINGKQIIFEAGGELELAHLGIEFFQRRQIFSGATRTKIRWIGNYPDVIYPEWFGVVPNVDTTQQRDANDVAMATCLESFQSDLSRGNNPTTTTIPYFHVTSGTVKLANAVYYFNKPVVNNAGIELDSVGGAIIQGATDKVVLRLNGNLTRGDVDPLDDTLNSNYGEYNATGANYGSQQTSNPVTINLTTPLPKNLLYGWGWLQGGTGNLPVGQSVGGNIQSISADGLTITVNVINRYYNSTPPNSWDLPQINSTTPLPAFSGATFRAVLNRGGADYLPRVKNIEIRGSRSVGNTHTVNIDGENINWVSGDKFDMDKRYLFGVTFTHEGITYLVGNHPTSPAPDNQMKLRRLRMNFGKLSPNNYYCTNIPGGGSSRWVGATVICRETQRQHTITGVSGGAITLDGVDEEAGEFWLTTLPLANYTGVQIQVHNKSFGLDARVHYYAENVTIRYCDVGIAADSLIRPTVGARLFGSQPNQNNAKVVDCRMFDNKVGMYARGINANNMAFHNCDYQNNYVQMIDESQHPNSHYSLHGQGNNQGIIAGTLDGVQAPVFYDPYLEDDQLGFDCGAKTVIHGGGATLSSYQQTGATILFPNYTSVGFIGSPYETITRSTFNPGGGTQTFRRLFTKVGDSFWKHFLSFGEKPVNDWVKSWHLSYQDLGYYGFQYDENSAGGHQINWTWNPAMEFTTSDAPVGGGQIRFGKGFILRNMLATARPAANADNRGRVWMTEGGAGAADKVEICLKKADDTYAWVQIVTA